MNKITSLIIVAVLIGGGVWWWFVSDNSSMSMDDMMPGMSVKGGLTKLTDENVPEVQPTQVVELKNGDTFVGHINRQSYSLGFCAFGNHFFFPRMPQDSGDMASERGLLGEKSAFSIGFL